jgi:acetoin utilization protein AcuB
MMVATELVSDIILPVKTSDPVQKVLDRMAEFRIGHLPVVNGLEFLGLLSEEDLAEATDRTVSVKKLNIPLINISINENQHIYDVVRLFYEQQLTIVPVIDQMRNYFGMISINDMMEHIATIASVKETGGIIVLEINNRSNSLAHIAQIVESNNAQILSSYVQSFPDSTRLEVTLKLNRTDISAVTASFLRYDYIIKATFNDIRNDSTQDRYDQLMNYLNI